MIHLLHFSWLSFVKMLFLFTPFFVLNVYLSLTAEAEAEARKHVALRITAAVLTGGTIFYFAGQTLLKMFGLELDGFRIGAGILLMVTALDLALNNTIKKADRVADIGNIVVVPMAIPTILGPSCASFIMIMGAEQMRAGSVSHLFAGYTGILGAIAALGAILYFSQRLEQIFGQKIIRIFSKVSGVILSAMASQMIVTGFFNYMDRSATGQSVGRILHRLEAFIDATVALAQRL